MSTIHQDTLNRSNAAASAHTAPSMVLGAAMPAAVDIPTLTDSLIAPSTSGSQAEGGHALSILQQGWQFSGRAQIKGACSISGSFEGQLEPLPGQSASIVITETGMVQADIRVSHASVMGLYMGTLDAQGGKVELHPSAIVSGHIRYGKLLVNDAELNATLERVVAVASTL